VVPSGGTVRLNAVVAKGHPLLFVIRWRRMPGLHLFNFVPLFAYASSVRLAAYAKAEEPPRISLPSDAFTPPPRR
ncbi:MAG TPA: hypothetical protein VF606_09790, partial [Geminicoccaceae bacterium]